MIKLSNLLNEASMPPVRKVVNAILKKHGIVPMKTTSTSVRGFHNIQRGGYRYEGNYFLGFYGVAQDVIDKVGAEMKAAGVKGVDVRKGIISADFTINGLKESVNEAKPAVVGNVNAFGPSKVLGKGGKVLGFVPDTPNAIATLIQDYPNVQAIEFKSPFFLDFKTYKSIKKGDKAWKELMNRGVDTATKAALKKDFQLKESVNEAKVK